LLKVLIALTLTSTCLYSDTQQNSQNAQEYDKKDGKKEDKEEDNKKEKAKTGNFALPTSQQPSPFFSIGQNIVEKGDFLATGTNVFYKGPCQKFPATTLNLLYGITDQLSVFFDIPEASKYQHARTITSEVDYVTLGSEYSFYTKEEETHTKQATVLTTLQIPYTYIPPISEAGIQGITYLLGGTAAYMSSLWYLFISGGFSLTKPKRAHGIFTQFIYENGIGINLGNPDGWIALALFEFNGVYALSFKAPGQFLPATNLIFWGPGLFLSSKRIILQAGFQWPIVQTGFTLQSKMDFRAAVALTWKF